MDYNKAIEQSTAAVDEWDEHIAKYGGFGEIRVNTYIEKHEATFVCSGLFLGGLRVKSGYNLKPHETIDGVAGIVSMNVEVLRNRNKQI